MNADQLREIRERHERDRAVGRLVPSEYVYRWEESHTDRAALLAEVDRLRAFVEKVREASTEADASDTADKVDAALTELRASK